MDSVIPAMMTNYLKNAGYPSVWTGLYLERMDYLENIAFLQETVDYAAASGKPIRYLEPVQQNDSARR